MGMSRVDGSLVSSSDAWRRWLRAFGAGATAIVALCGASCDSEPDLGHSEAFVDVASNTAIRPVPRQDIEFLARQAEIAALPDRESIELVFLGDSITQRWESEGRYTWNERYLPLHAANLGINGDRTEHVLWRIEQGNLDGMHPRVVVVLIGTNNTYFNDDEQIATAVLAVVSRVEARLPDSKILLVGLLPKRRDGRHPMRARIVHINEILRQQARERGVDFLDVGRDLTEPDGSLSSQYLRDGLHLSERGYARLGEALAPALSELLTR